MEKILSYFPLREDIDSWATRVGALAVISALISLSFGNVVPVTDEIGQAFVTLTKIFLMILTLAPLLSIILNAYSSDFKDRTGTAFWHHMFSACAAVVTVFAAFPAFADHTRHILGAIAILTLVILFSFLPYLVKINKRDTSVPPTTE